MDLNFCVNNAILTRTDQAILVNKSKNYLACNFQFNTPEWEGITKFALFKNEENESFPVPLGNDTNCNCNIPSSVLKGDFFKVMVYGGDLITTNEKTVVLLESGYTGEYDELVDDDKDILVSIFEKIEERIDHVEYDDGILIFKSGNIVLERISLIADIALSTTSENPVQNKTITTALETKAEKIHNHVHTDVTDFGDAMDNDMNKFLRLLGEEIAKE